MTEIAACWRDNQDDHKHDFRRTPNGRTDYQCSACRCFGYARSGIARPHSCDGTPGESCSLPAVVEFLRSRGVTPSRRMACRNHKHEDAWKSLDR